MPPKTPKPNMPPEADASHNDMMLEMGAKHHETLQNIEQNSDAHLLKSDEIVTELKDIGEKLDMQMMQEHQKPEVQKIEIQPIQATDDEDELAVTFYRMLRGKKGEKGDKGDKGDTGDALTFDMLTDAEKAEIKGEKGDQGEKGEKGDSIVGPQGPIGPQGPQGSMPEIDYDLIASKVTVKDGKDGKPGKSVTAEEVLKKLKGKITIEDIAELKDIVDFLQKKHGGVASKTVSAIELDDIDLSQATLQNGKYVIPPVATGSLNVLVATGTVDDSNTTFDFVSTPTLVVINGLTYRNGSTSGGVPVWTIVGTTVTLAFPVGAGGDIYALG